MPSSIAVMREPMEAQVRVLQPGQSHNNMMYLEDKTIPKPLYDALVDSNQEYGKEVKDYLAGLKKNYDFKISATALNKPTQESVLLKRHSHEIWVNPLKDCWHSMMGNVVHWVLEKYAALDPDNVTEFRLGCDIEVDGKICHIHGKFDLYVRSSNKLQDWKLTSASSMAYPKVHYEMQLNILRYILLKNGWVVKELEDVYLFPHLDKTKLRMEGYPQHNALTVSVQKMPIADVEEYIKDRLRAQLTEKDKPDSELTPCTNEERWIRTSEWLVYTRKKGGRKGEVQDFSSRSAHRAQTKKELVAWRKDKGIAKDDVKYKKLEGDPKHCEYCQARFFCRQNLAYLKQKETRQ